MSLIEKTSCSQTPRQLSSSAKVWTLFIFSLLVTVWVWKKSPKPRWRSRLINTCWRTQQPMKCGGRLGITCWTHNSQSYPSLLSSYEFSNIRIASNSKVQWFAGSGLFNHRMMECTRVGHPKPVAFLLNRGRAACSGSLVPLSQFDSPPRPDLLDPPLTSRAARVA